MTKLPVIDDPARLSRRVAYGAMLAAVAGVLGAAILNARPLLSANDRSRWCTVWSLVERGTYVIDEIDSRPGWSTIDKVRHEDHFYSSKPPLLATLDAGVYWLIRKTTGWTLLSHTADVARLVLVFTQLIPWLAALWIVTRIAERYVRTDTARLLLVATAAFGTLVTTFTVTLNNHSVAAVPAIFAIYAALRVLENAKRHPASQPSPSPEPPAPSPDFPGFPQSAIRNPQSAVPYWHAALAGFFAAFTCACESPAALFGVALFLLVLRAAPRAALFAFVPAALIPLAAYFGTNWLATGGLKPFQASYGSDKYEYVHEGVPSYWKDPKGLDRNVDSPSVYLLHCTVGHHGIFSLTPMWLLSLGGWLSLRRRDGSPLRPFLWMGLGLFLAVLGFYLTRTQNYNYGGNSAGLRWMIWLAPFFLLAIVPVAEQWGSCWRFRLFALSLLAASAFSAHYSLANPWTQPWLFTLMQNVGWLKQYEPQPPPKFARPQTTWFASIPKAESNGKPQWVEYTGADAEGRGTTWRLSTADTASNGGELRHEATIRLTQTAAGELPVVHEFRIDRDAFDSGEPPSKFLRWPDGPPDDGARNAAETLLRGLPADASYGAGVVRYLKFPLRRDAFRCQGAAAWVRHKPAGSSREVWHRTDLWRCDDVPFGVMQIETVISDAVSGQIVSQRRMTISGHSRMP